LLKGRGKNGKRRNQPEEGRKRQVIPSVVSLHTTEACAKTTHNVNDLLGASTQKRLQAYVMTLPRRGGTCYVDFFITSDRQAGWYLEVWRIKLANCTKM